ncbi:hypothetical protein Taro_045954 [Colocasia esculenta]|uniref:Uncharacterized protein n=1 Tax=Colocasia esculenta TaxID=4460 RepID=A0A843WNI0_COLES|nr:hypothetical protein [Colocasia esculenta]
MVNKYVRVLLPRTKHGPYNVISTAYPFFLKEEQWFFLFKGEEKSSRSAGCLSSCEIVHNVPLVLREEPSWGWCQQNLAGGLSLAELHWGLFQEGGFLTCNRSEFPSYSERKRTSGELGVCISLGGLYPG